MTEPQDPQVRALIDELIGAAPAPPLLPDPHAVRSVRRARRTAVVAVALMCAMAVAATLVWVSRVGTHKPQIVIEQPTTSVPSTSVPSTTGDAAPLTRPIITTAGCIPISAYERHETVTLFAWPSTKRTVQVLADPTRGAAGPYAIVERFFVSTRSRGVGSFVDINGRRAEVYVGIYGQGAVEWTLADGSEGYIRTRGFDRAGLVSLARALRPRRVQSPVAGFDLASPAPSRLAILGETAGTVEGDSVSSMCRLPDGSTITVLALRGNPVFQYGTALDALPLPVIDQRDDTVVVVFGPKSAATTALTSVHNATPQQWGLLLRAHSGHA